ncbi:hypothetical protein ACQPYK_09900 [Streptosporangium sp. CA-135522]|uniref:hypothetical protein n=1 Tax=Streptosporangium sp. CA-135522 TaxID=3240072 RepID=UPI003D8E26EC
MKAFSTIALVLSTLSAGLMAGLFAAFAYSVMPGLRQSSDRARRIERDALARLRKMATAA